jgi:hypothetical protein
MYLSRAKIAFTDARNGPLGSTALNVLGGDLQVGILKRS